MRASFDLTLHLPSQRAVVVQWPGRAKYLPAAADPRLLASGRADATPLLLRGLGPTVVLRDAGSERNVALLTEEQALRAVLLLDVLGMRGGASEDLVDHIAQLTTDQTVYWVREMLDPVRSDRARRALRTLAS